MKKIFNKIISEMLLFINIIDELPSLINNNKFSVSTQGNNTIIKKNHPS